MGNHNEFLRSKQEKESVGTLPAPTLLHTPE